jgi:translation initiation factor IF-2
LQALLPSEHIVEEVGKVGVLANFRKTENGWIVGGRVKVGSIMTGTHMRVLRQEELIGEGSIEKLQVGKTEVKEVSAGQECGIRYKGRIKVEEGDILEIYKEEDKGQKLEIEGIRRR